MRVKSRKIAFFCESGLFLTKVNLLNSVLRATIRLKISFRACSYGQNLSRLPRHSMCQMLGQGQTSNFSCAEPSNVNELSSLFHSFALGSAHEKFDV